MPLPIPDLDDRTFDQLVDEAKVLIAKHFPIWTDHNFSDPGITFLDLFAFMAENAIYQINRVPDRSLEHFASLLGVMRRPGESIEELLSRVRAKLDARERAVTQDEIKQQILAQPAQRWPQARKIARAEVIVELQTAPGVFPAQLSLKNIIVPEPEDENDLAPQPSRELRQAVFEFLSERVLIATRLQVLPPDYYSFFELRAAVVRSAQSRLDRATVHQNVVEAVRAFLHPTRGGKEGHGWPLGRSIFRSELYGIIEGLPGVDHVRELLLLETQELRARQSVRDVASLPASREAEAPSETTAIISPADGEFKSPERISELRLPGPTSLIKWSDETVVVTVVDQ